MAKFRIKRFSTSISPTVSLSLNYLEHKYGLLPESYKNAVINGWNGFKLMKKLDGNQSQFIDNFIEIGNPDRTWTVQLFPTIEVESITKKDHVHLMRDFVLKRNGLLIIGSDIDGVMYLIMKPGTSELYIVEQNNKIAIPKRITKEASDVFNETNYNAFIVKDED